MVALHENKLNGILADDMGMGKTIQAISIIAYMKETMKIKEPYLVLAPKSTISNWMREFKLWVPMLKVVNLIPTKDERKEIIETALKPGKFDVCITTYDAIGRDECFQKLKKTYWHYIVFDEAHKLKNS